MADKVDSKDSAVVQQEHLQIEDTSDTDYLAIIKKHAQSKTPYFTIKVLNTTTGNHHCYLSTLDNSMLYNPIVPRGNSSLIWILEEQPQNEKSHWFISNAVTARSNSLPFAQQTYMNLGTGVSGSPNTNYIVLFGPKTEIYLKKTHLPYTFVMYTYTDVQSQTKAYLQPLSSKEDENGIVAKVEDKPSHFFEIKPMNETFIA